MNEHEFLLQDRLQKIKDTVVEMYDEYRRLHYRLKDRE